MQLSDIIERLEQEDPARVVAKGFANPHSYRGDYYQLALEPVERITVGEMLSAARSAVGETYEGYKGGSYYMDGDTSVYLASEGCSGEELTPTHLECMLGACSAAREARESRERALRYAHRLTAPDEPWEAWLARWGQMEALSAASRKERVDAIAGLAGGAR